MALRRSPDRTIDHSNLVEGSQSSAPRLMPSSRSSASRSFSSIRSVVPPQRHSVGIYPQQISRTNEDSLGSTAAATKPAVPPAVVETPNATERRAGNYTDSVYKRAVWLMSDAVVLTIASPFIAVWWIGRVVKRMFGPK